MRPVVVGNKIPGDIQTRSRIDDRDSVRIDEQRNALRLRVGGQRGADVLLQALQLHGGVGPDTEGSGPFSLDSAISLDFLEEAAKARALTRTVLPLTAALDDIPALPVTPDQAQLLRHGQKLVGIPAQPGLQLATSDGVPVALVEAAADGLRVVRGFNL